MRVKSVIIIAIIITFTSLLGITFVFPAIDDLMVENPYWNGLSEVYTLLYPSRIKKLDQIQSIINPEISTLLILGPSTSFSEQEVQIVNDFLFSGGRLVLADDFGSGNDLLRGLDLTIRINGYLLQDQLFKEKNGLMPKIFDIKYSDIDNLVMNYASIISFSGDASIGSYSSPFSYISSSPALPEDAINSGPFPLVVETNIGEGEIFIISDSSLFINSMIGKGDNKEFLLKMVHGDVYIDESHIIPSRLSSVRGYILSASSFLGLIEIRYGVSFIGLFLILSVTWMKDEQQETPEEEVNKLMREHPEYDRELVESLSEKRSKAHGYN